MVSCIQRFQVTNMAKPCSVLFLFVFSAEHTKRRRARSSSREVRLRVPIFSAVCFRGPVPPKQETAKVGTNRWGTNRGVPVEAGPIKQLSPEGPRTEPTDPKAPGLGPG